VKVVYRPKTDEIGIWTNVRSIWTIPVIYTETASLNYFSEESMFAEGWVYIGELD
jgi:hypothetical protein